MIVQKKVCVKPTTKPKLPISKTGGFPAFGAFDEFEVWKDVYTAGEVRADFNIGKAHGLERSDFPALEMLIPDFDPEIIKRTDYYTFVLEALEVIS